MGTSLFGALHTRGGLNLPFSTEIAVYLGNGMSEAHGYYGSLTVTGSHT